ncbi:LacI family transcriptional regulator [Microlunatus elymi]|uniref:LacI family transcriptional regulator n=1 Tax=Microlunatus elymi TaxID=2596828 RepID=A0A516PW11_9ACTN|nr:LacI family DNA-binding transcriptional regulator [Microlunatus elymi]QDP95363.1 LacI family transcriptional regulator [Microlunatus elymi]
MALTSNPRTRATIKQVAEHAGVSETTVSHVLSGNRPVAESTQERVRRAVREVGYRPSSIARSLRISRSMTVSLIIPDLTNPFYTVLARGLADELDAQGYRLTICNTDGARDREQDFIDDALDRHVDGIAMTSYHLATSEVQRVIDLGVPIVCMGESIDHPSVDRVITDGEQGAWEATRHLLERGSQRIAMIAGAKDLNNDRISGYRSALRSVGRRVSRKLVAYGEWTRDGGRQAMHSLIKIDPKIDAVFCGNDLMAIGAMDALTEIGRSIPDDVALVGFDDIDAASLVRPALTTIANPAYDSGRAAGKQLLQRMLGERTGPRTITTLPCNLRIRESA